MKLFQRLTIIFLVIIISFISGVWGALIIENLYPTSFVCFNGLQDKKIEKQKNGVLLFKEDNKVLDDVSIRSIQKSIIGIARVKKKSKDVLNNYYLPQDIIAYGFVLTDDGWIVTVANNLEKEINSDLVILNGGKVFSFKEKILDPSTGILFLKVETDGNILTPIKISDSNKVKILDEMISVDLFGNTLKHNLISIDSFNNLIQSSEVLGRRFVVSGGVISGSILVNAKAEVVGIVDNFDNRISKVIPISYLSNKISQLLKNKKIERNFLGVNYIDLAKFSQNNQFSNINQKRGAFIFSSQIIDAIVDGSPAQLAGIKYKDIIISIEGEELGVNKNLSEIIQEYKSGSEIKVEILRAGKKLNLNVKLINIK